MTKDEYRDLRRKLGTQSEVAAMLDITTVTVYRRESGETPVSREAAIAIQSLVRGRGRSKRLSH